MRRFVGIDLGREPVPDETTLCKFRHLLERHDLGAALFQRVHEHLEQHGLKLSAGTIVDATIIHAPSSTKNAAQARDPEMHQTRKGNQWYFGMKAHIGVDSRSKVIHSVVATAANVADAHRVVVREVDRQAPGNLFRAPGPAHRRSFRGPCRQPLHGAAGPGMITPPGATTTPANLSST